jgi:hypothetical protein
MSVKVEPHYCVVPSKEEVLALQQPLQRIIQERQSTITATEANLFRVFMNNNNNYWMVPWAGSRADWAAYYNATQARYNLDYYFSTPLRAVAVNKKSAVFPLTRAHIAVLREAGTLGMLRGEERMVKMYEDELGGIAVQLAAAVGPTHGPESPAAGGDDAKKGIRAVAPAVHVSGGIPAGGAAGEAGHAAAACTEEIPHGSDCVAVDSAADSWVLTPADWAAGVFVRSNACSAKDASGHRVRPVYSALEALAYVCRSERVRREWALDLEAEEGAQGAGGAGEDANVGAPAAADCGATAAVAAMAAHPDAAGGCGHGGVAASGSREKAERIAQQPRHTLVLSPWKADVSEGREFRVFVHEGVVTAISQYSCYLTFEWMADAARLEAVGAAIVRFLHARVLPHLPFIDCVVDVDVDVAGAGAHAGTDSDSGSASSSESATEEGRSGRGRAKLGGDCEFCLRFIECNPFGAEMASGSALFDWTRDYNLMYAQPDAHSAAMALPRSAALPWYGDKPADYSAADAWARQMRQRVAIRAAVPRGARADAVELLDPSWFTADAKRPAE